MHGDEPRSEDVTERLRAQETALPQVHDTTGLAAELRQLQNDIESEQLAGTIRLARARGHLDTTPDDASDG